MGISYRCRVDMLAVSCVQCGGSALAVRAAKPLLQLMGKQVEHLGDVGSGQVQCSAGGASRYFSGLGCRLNSLWQ